MTVESYAKSVKIVITRGVKMETTINRQELLQLIYAHLDIVPDNILEEVLELLEEEKYLIDYDLAMEDIKINGTVPWEKLKKEMKRDVA
ncbi:hypothetical protein F7734_00350 [Scytonema sp. UIC 10036]|uniref:hypothetical protein n=1 Tax=Scytonema sp. UIC 10036 TaxID=2304196 RepID=UPI0012DA4C0A|nr:hypothetical protein [Scytonema sp. UIC 10036]MUG91034.1 hypothetical protein [Scytonema sp. UIC 10036]